MNNTWNPVKIKREYTVTKDAFNEVEFETISTCAFTLIQGGCKQMSEGEKAPDVLFITVDDLNDWTGCLGGREEMHTPNLDRLASTTMLFTNAHCTAPACCPSRTSVMTGVRPSASGVYHNNNE